MPLFEHDYLSSQYLFYGFQVFITTYCHN